MLIRWIIVYAKLYMPEISTNLKAPSVLIRREDGDIAHAMIEWTVLSYDDSTRTVY